MTEYAYSRKLDSISEETSMSTIRSVLSSSTSGARVTMGLLRCPRGILPRRIGLVAEARRGLAGSDDLVDLVLEGVAVRAPDPGHDRRKVLRPSRVEALEREAVSQDLLHGVQLADRDPANPLRSVGSELAVDHRIVLAVVTDEQPRDLWEVARELPQGVPGARGDVDDGRSGMVLEDRPVELGHPGNRLASVLRDHQRVPGGDEGTREVRGDDGVVDVAHDPERHVLRDDEHVRRGGLCLGGGDLDRVPAGRQPMVADLRVDVALAVCDDLVPVSYTHLT